MTPTKSSSELLGQLGLLLAGVVPRLSDPETAEQAYVTHRVQAITARLNGIALGHLPLEKGSLSAELADVIKLVDQLNEAEGRA